MHSIIYGHAQTVSSGTLPSQFMWGEFPWKAGDVQHAARNFGRGPKFHSNATVRRPRVSESGGAARNRPSARVTPITKTTRYAHNAHGKNAILTTGANTAARMYGIPNETAHSNVNAMIGNASARLQRWTPQHRFSPCPQVSTRSARPRYLELQKWTRGQCKLLCYQQHTIG